MSHRSASTLAAAALHLFLLPLLAASVTAQDFGGIYTSGDGGFSIAISDEPTERQQVFEHLGPYTLMGNAFVWEDEDETIMIQVCRVFTRTSRTLTPLQKKAVIDGYKKGITGEFARHRVATVEKPYEFQGGTGVEVRSVPPKLVSRILFLNERLVVLGVIRGDDSGADLQLELLDSFRLLPKEQHIAVLIRENMPGPLPQGERTASLPPDTAAAGLRPGVSQVVETFQQAPTSEKERSKELYFDKAGNLIKEIQFLAGYPDQIRVWGWVDGARVSRSATVNYRHDQFYGPGQTPMNVGGTPGLPKIVDSLPGSVTFKPLYGLRYDLTTDQSKRVTERRVTSGAGVLSYVEKITYTANGVETRTIDGSGGFISRVVEVVDKNGLPIEEKTLDSAGRPYGTGRHFAYDFDANGNWITKRVSIKSQARRGVVDKPLGVYSRVISYH